MALEDLTGTKYIDSLVVTNPAAGDSKGEGDDHIRGIKNVLVDTFPNITGAITATEAELNTIDGFTGNTADLNAIAGIDALGVTPTEIGYLNGSTTNIETRITNAFDRTFHNGTQAMSTISDAGALATLNTVAAAQVDTAAVGANKLISTTTLLGNDNSLSASETLSITDDGPINVHIRNSGSATVVVEVLYNTTWRAALTTSSSTGVGAGFFSTGSNIRIRETGGAAGGLYALSVMADS